MPSDKSPSNSSKQISKMATALAAATVALPMSSPLLFRQNAETYPVMNLNNIFSQQFPPPPPIMTQLEQIAVEPLDDNQMAIDAPNEIPQEEAAPIGQAKVRELKSLVREFNYKMFSMPVSVDNRQVNLATETLNTIIDSPILFNSTIYRPPQAIWVPLFESFFKTMEQLPDGVEMRELALDIEIAFTNILGSIEDGEIDYVQYTVIMFASS